MDELCSPHTALRDFRTSLYDCLDRRADALFELGDAILAAGPQPSLAHLSLADPHRLCGARSTMTSDTHAGSFIGR